VGENRGSEFFIGLLRVLKNEDMGAGNVRNELCAHAESSWLHA
jgi:hypothetical protein